MKREELLNILNYERENEKCKWYKGVLDYAIELIDINDIDKEDFEKVLKSADKVAIEKYLLNGAESWSVYSWSGNSLIYNGDICERLATPSEQKQTDYGRIKPNRREEWLDTQARALKQAFEKIARIIENEKHFGMIKAL